MQMVSDRERDRELLEMLAQHRAVVDLHVQELLGVGPAAAAKRLRRLDRGGLICYERIFDRLPGSVSIARRGLAAIGSRLPVPNVSFEGYRHDVGVAWLWLAARSGAYGSVSEMHTDRSMHSHDRRLGREGRPFGVGLGAVGPRGGEQLHYPDLLLTLASGHRVAIELELTVKSRSRLDGIMLGYAADGRIDAVLYLVPDRAGGRSVLDAAQRAGITEGVHVQLLAPGSPEGAPPGGRRRDRAPERRRERAGR